MAVQLLHQPTNMLNIHSLIMINSLYSLNIRSDRHLFWTASWQYLETCSKSPKKQVAGSDSLWQQPPARWFKEIC